MNWILIIAVGGFLTNISGVDHISMTERQCKETIRQMASIRGQIGALCVGPHGEKFGFEDVE